MRGFSWVAAAAGPRTRRQFRQGTVAFGPQHPAAHGILKLQLQLHGEVLRWLDPQFGLLHRGSEKLMEGRTLLQALPYFDRFDYVANLFSEHAYCLAVEALSARAAPVSALTLLARTVFDELSRILNHLLTLSATALDLSAMGPIFWAFEERENVLELCERASGARMHTALYRPHTFDASVLTAGYLRDLAHFLTRCGRSLAGAFLGLLNNRSLKSRLSGVGQLSASKVRAYGVTGLIARSAGCVADLRLGAGVGYGAYRSLSLRTYLGRRGDNWDRFILRVKETAEAFRTLTQLVRALGHAAGVRLEPGRGKFGTMEGLIAHFRQASEGWPTVAGVAYRAVESPKGEVGVLLVGVGGARASRTKLRTAVGHNMHLIPTLGVGVTFADFVATFCSLDIVLGEIDR